MIQYQDSIGEIGPAQLVGFFVGWVRPLSPEKHLAVMQQSDYVILALDSETDKVVGFITAMTDSLFAYVPLLEVLPEYQGRGIGKSLVSKMLEILDGLYSVDLLCDPPLQSFYAKCGMANATGMTLKNY